MNMRSILIFLAVLALAANVFAAEVQEEPKIGAPSKMEPDRKNPSDARLAAPIVTSQSIPQAAERPNEFISALSVYLLIVIVYSIYGITANSKNTGN